MSDLAQEQEVSNVRRFKPYSAYEPSGLEWLGDLPEHWQPSRLGYLTKKVGSGKTPKGGAETYQSEGVLLIRGQNVHDAGLQLNDAVFIDDLVDEDMIGTRVASGDVLLNITGASLGRCAIATQELPRANVNQHVCIVRVQSAKAAPEFVRWMILSRPVQSQIFSYENGSSREGLNFQQVKGLLLALPSLPEQRTIAEFLRQQISKIDTLIAKKFAVIQKLEEKRSALISRTVTRGLPPAEARSAGLDPYPPLKSSGVDWIGDIPKHWALLPYKRLCNRVDVGIAEAATHAYSDDGVAIIRSTNVRPNTLDTRDVLRIEPWFAEKNKSKTLHAGDLVTVRTGYPGTTAVIPPEYEGSQCFTLVMSTPKPGECSRFFSYFFNSAPGSTYFEMEGWGTAQTNISVPIVQCIPVARPPENEQRLIVAFLDSQTTKLDAMLLKIHDATERLQEYRAALITAAVTGKIDVRGEAA